MILLRDNLQDSDLSTNGERKIVHRTLHGGLDGNMSSWSMELEGGAQRWIWQSSTSNMFAWFGSSLGLQSLDGSPWLCYPKTFTQKIVHSCWSQELIVLPDWWIYVFGVHRKSSMHLYPGEQSIPVEPGMDWSTAGFLTLVCFILPCKGVINLGFHLAFVISLCGGGEIHLPPNYYQEPYLSSALGRRFNFNVGARKVLWSLPMKLSRRIWWEFFLMTYCQLPAGFPPFSNCPWDWERIVYSLQIASGHIGEHVFSGFSQLNPRHKLSRSLHGGFMNLVRWRTVRGRLKGLFYSEALFPMVQSPGW